MSSAHLPNIVIVGGGLAGAGVAKALSDKIPSTKANIILINTLPYVIYWPATARLAVSSRDKLEENALIPYDKLFTKGNGVFKQGTVTAIETSEKGGSVLLADGERIQYTILVVATGSRWRGPIDFPSTPEKVHEHIRESHEQFEDAKKIVCVGGGAVGIEFAGEIKDLWPSKEVTIVHGDKQLLNAAYPDKYRKAIENDVTARDVHLVLGEYVDEIPDVGQPAITRSGKTLDSDLVIDTRGPRPNTELLSQLSPPVLAANHFVKVRPTLQVEGHDSIFAVGDIVDIKEQKQAAKAGSHAAVVAANVLSYLDGRPLKKEYKGSPELIIITNGSERGVAFLGFLWGIVLGNWFSRFLKSRTLMVPQGRAALGY